MKKSIAAIIVLATTTQAMPADFYPQDQPPDYTVERYYEAQRYPYYPAPGPRYPGYTPYPYYPHPGWPACPPGTEWGYGCVAWAPAPPGMLFGACIREAHSCFRIPGQIQ